MQLNGQYFDGIASIGHEAQLSLVGHTVTVTWTGGRQSFDAGDLSVERPLGLCRVRSGGERLLTLLVTIRRH